MNNAKAPASSSYQDYLISRLSDRTYAATYLETHLEETTSEPELLHLALLNVSEALTRSQPSLQKADHRQKLDDLLNQPGSQAIQHLVNWLAELGLKLTIIAQQPIISLGEISSNVTHTIDQLQSANPQAVELVDLLKQLQSAIESDPNLAPPDKTEALEQVGTLAKAGEDPQNGTLKKIAGTSLKILKGTVAALPSTATIAKAELLPAIAKLLGI